LLDLNEEADGSSTRALHLPRLGYDERDELFNPGEPNQPAEGLLIFNTDTKCLEFWNSEEWISLCEGDTPFDPCEPLPSAGVISGFNLIHDVRLSTQNTTQLSTDGTPGGRWSSSDPTIATVSQTGLVTGIKFGPPVTITYTVGRGACLETADYLVYVGCGANTRTGANLQWLAFMCYNLGADQLTIEEQMAHLFATPVPAITDATVFGDLYQWGRTDDGHQIRNPRRCYPHCDNIPAGSGGNPNAALDDTDLDSNGQVLDTHPAFGHFIRQAAVPNNWRLTPDATLWNSGTDQNPVKSVNDPCPDGWRIPTEAEWISIFGSGNGGVPDAATTNTWTLIDNGLTGGNQRFGYLITPPGVSVPTLFLSNAGLLSGNTANLTLAGGGHYWSSFMSPLNGSSLILSFTIIVPGTGAARVHGASVRCVVDE
jgi:uncharacterized protein (TIGR02145 family)